MIFFIYHGIHGNHGKRIKTKNKLLYKRSFSVLTGFLGVISANSFIDFSLIQDRVITLLILNLFLTISCNNKRN